MLQDGTAACLVGKRQDLGENWGEARSAGLCFMGKNLNLLCVIASLMHWQ